MYLPRSPQFISLPALKNLAEQESQMVGEKDKPEERARKEFVITSVKRVEEGRKRSIDRYA